MVVVAAEPTTTVSGDPPPDSDDEELITTTAEPTTSAGPTTTSTEPATTDSFSVVGSIEDSRFDPFQVEVYFEDEAIVAVEALQLPTDRKSTAINNSAVSIYEDAIIAAQSADIDVISGADGHLRELHGLSPVGPRRGGPVVRAEEVMACGQRPRPECSG